MLFYQLSIFNCQCTCLLKQNNKLYRAIFYFIIANTIIVKIIYILYNKNIYTLDGCIKYKMVGRNNVRFSRKKDIHIQFN